jgi:hypothetical protein
MKKAGTWLIVLGWIFSVLGGVIGILIGANLATGKAKGPNGEKVYKYDDNSRKQGIPMLAIGTLMFGAGLAIRLTS